MNNDFHVFCAPLQGYTDYIWRNAHAEIFGGVGCYFTPFMRVEHGKIPNRDLRDVACENNDQRTVIPQVLACSPHNVRLMVDKLEKGGYTRIDINLGCPFPPIALHHKGSGLLQYPQELREVFLALSEFQNLKFSVKMRLGWEHDDDWEAIWPLFDIIQPSHITIHPRTGREQYKGEFHWQQFEAILKTSNYPIIFNGGINSMTDVEAVKERYSNIAGVMIGRGLIANPALTCPEKLSKKNLKNFHDRLFDAYTLKLNGGAHQVLKKMKAFWELFLPDANHKARKLIKKSTTIEKYQSAVNMAFEIDNLN